MKVQNIIITGIGLALAALLIPSVKKELAAIKSISFEPGQTPFKLKAIKSGAATGTLSLVIINPSSFKMEALQIVIDLTLHNGLLAKVFPFNMAISSSSKTPVSIPVSITLKKLLRLAEGLILKKSVDVKFKGTATVKALGVLLPVNFEFILDVKEEIKNFLQENYPSNPLLSLLG